MFVKTFHISYLNIKFVDAYALCLLVINLVEMQLILSNFTKIPYLPFWDVKINVLELNFDKNSSV